MNKMYSLFSWLNRVRYQRYAKKISNEFALTLYRNTYKLDRLSNSERRFFFDLIRSGSIKHLADKTDLTDEEIYCHIDTLMSKLDLRNKSSLIDIDWKNALGQ